MMNNRKKANKYKKNNLTNQKTKNSLIENKQMKFLSQ